MIEVELKFQVPAHERERVSRGVLARGAVTRLLHTVYVDTPDGALAAAGMALRLRQDAGRWIQTFKAAGADLLHRVEHEVPVPAPGRRRVPAVDVCRHDGTRAGVLLRTAVADPAALHAVFETVFERTSRVVRAGPTSIELAFDDGEIRAGQRRLPLCELELEWRSGPLAGLFTLAERWQARHDLWLDVRSKAERGACLARGLACVGPTLARRPTLKPDMGPDAALRAMVRNGLSHLLPNTSAVAAGVGQAEHLHQSRVALRRLRSALRLFGDGSSAVDATWEPALAALFDAFGAARDRDAISVALLPALRAAGAPLADWPESAPAADDGAPLRSRAVNRQLLALMAFAHGQPPAEPKPLAACVRPLLRRLHRQLVRDGERFAELDDEARHRARRRVKRLRYGIEFVAALLPARRVARYLARLAPAQEALGHFNDIGVAQQAFRAIAERDARAWFAVGWLQAQRAEAIDEARRALRRLGRGRLLGKP